MPVLDSVEDLSRILIWKTSEIILFSILGLEVVGAVVPVPLVVSAGGVDVTGPVVVFLEVSTGVF